MYNHYNKYKVRTYLQSQWDQTQARKTCKSYFFVKGAFVELFTVMIQLRFFGCDVQQERNWEFMMYIPCYIGNGKMAKQ